MAEDATLGAYSGIETQKIMGEYNKKKAEPFSDSAFKVKSNSM